MPTTKVVRVPNAVAIVFHHANDRLTPENIHMHGPVQSLASWSGEAHEVDFEPGVKDMKAKAMNYREARGVLGNGTLRTEAHVFSDADGRGEPTVPETLRAVNDELEPPRQGLLAKMMRRLG